MAKDNYGAESLTVLEGLDAVRKRPGMYIGTTDSQGLMHCLWEIIDNAVDEALAGACNHIIVTLHDDGSVEVADNGRGIPVDVEPKTKLTGVEVVLTKLHAGAKFGNSSYGASGGLHGVGSSVVNALSSRLDVEVDRDGKTHHMAFHQGHPGVYSDVDPEHPSPDSPFKKTRKNRPTELEIIGKVSPKTTGTRIRYWADPEIFNDTAEFSYDQLIDRVRQTSFLVPGLKITVIDENIPETGDESIDEMLEVDDNVIEQVTEENTSAETDDIGTSADILQEDSAEADESAESQENDAATQSQETVSQPVQPKYPHARVEEFCHTGGVKDFVDFLSKGEAVSDIWRIAGEDTYVEETQAVGDDGELHAQKVTRDCAVDIAMRWTNGYDTTMRSFVNVVETPGGGMHVDGFLQGITKQVRKAIEDNARKLKVNLKDSHMKVERDDILAGLVAVVTVRIAEPQFQGQTKDVLGTAQVKPIVSRMTELFIVEGDSALGTAKAARNSGFQALLPIRGKILNVQKASLAQMLSNKECAAIIQVVGAGSGASFDIEQARYNKIIMMTDADVDGAHIRILLLTLFYRYMRPLIEYGHVYAAVPPLHRIALTGTHKGEYIYTYSDDELAGKLAELDKKHIGYNEDIQRYKGLGEMDADQLADTTMDPRTRMLRRIRMEDAEQASHIFSLLMGDDVPPRKAFIVENADDFDRSKIDT